MTDEDGLVSGAGGGDTVVIRDSGSEGVGLEKYLLVFKQLEIETTKPRKYRMPFYSTSTMTFPLQAFAEGY